MASDTADPGNPSAASAREILIELYRAGVAAVAPGPALQAALEGLPVPDTERKVWVISLGKAAHPMARAAVEHLGRSGRKPAGGVVAAPDYQDPPADGLEVVAGDHPIPGPGSLAAAQAIGRLVARAGENDEAWVLLSGGATSLVGAPVAGLEPEDLWSIYRLLMTSGMDIAQMNSVRKRFSRWGAGRLAAGLHPAPVRTFAVSDVVGDAPGAIGSGPCVADPVFASDVRSLLEQRGLWEAMPPAARRLIGEVEAGHRRETPKPGAPELAGVEFQIVAGNAGALAAVARRAGELGLEVMKWPEPLTGEAAAAGRRLAEVLRGQPPGRPICLIAGGETVVTVGAKSGSGGRCQELALAGAERLAGSPAILLAAGTDGRDGPTDAAGALVDGSTWGAIRRAGRDPQADLGGHDSYPALAAAGALVKTGLTGTNVMDLVIGLSSVPEGYR